MCCKIKIVDQIPGAGKSFSAINYINNSSPDDRFIVITPFIDEIKRYQEFCPKKNFRTPSAKRGHGSKFTDIKQLIRKGYNIVSTHVLFSKFDTEIVELCKVLKYTLILDEVAEVIKECDITKDDIDNLLKNYCDVNKQTGMLKWRKNQQSYVGKFSDIKNMCNLGGVALARDSLLIWMFPVEVFNVFENVFVLTYMFNAQLQRYYYDYYNIQYEFLYVAGDSIDTYHFTSKPTQTIKYNYRELIHILENEKMNVIGDAPWNLSSRWFQRNKDTALMNQLRNNVYNFFFNIRKSKSNDNLWTTMNDYRPLLSGKGYSKGFLYLNARAINTYRTRTSLAYLFNVFLNPMVKGFFKDHKVKVDEDNYALSEMLQWIWRSAIRDGNEIWVYIPSSRMRNLLKNWIETISDDYESLISNY